jgi:hypothetical protein
MNPITFEITKMAFTKKLVTKLSSLPGPVRIFQKVL